MYGHDDGRNVFTTKNAVVGHHNNPRTVMDKVVGKVVPDVHNLFPISKKRFKNFQASSSALHLPLHNGQFSLILISIVACQCCF